MVRYKKIIYILFFILLSFNTNAKSPPPGTGTSDIPANILIMLDNSGSMSARLAGAVQIHYPVDVNVDRFGNVYVLEYWNNRIKKFDSSGNYLKSFGGPGSNCSQWRNARQFDIKDDVIYIADTANNRFVTLDLNGNCRATAHNYILLKNRPTAIAVGGGWVWASGGRSAPELIASHYIPSMYPNPGRNAYNNEGGGSNFIWGMSWNRAGSKIAYANYSQNEVRVANRSGHQLVAENRSYYSNRVITYNANRPTDTAWDSSGNIYYTSANKHAVYKINTSTGVQTKLVGSYSSTSGFRYPYGIEIDSSDNIYVTDYYNFTVRKYNTSGVETTSIGGSNTRLEAAKKVIKKIVSNTDLTSGANFGLMEWGSSANIRVKISDTGAQQIFTNVDGVRAGGGTNLLNAMNSARNYFTSGQVANWNQSCSQNYLIVISDGYWSSHNSVLGVADQIKNAYNIKTFAVGFALGGANNNYKTLAQRGGTVSPLYASNETDLLAKLTDAIKQAISGRLTFTTPAVMSDVTRGDFVYQATFEYEKNKQWKGSLKKYKLNTNGSFGAVQWDAATKLNNKNASLRKIWTSAISASGLNNFTTSNRDDLKPLLFPSQTVTDTQVDNLINFIRGVDTYDQDADNNKTESIHKLADIYHSNLIVVSPPEAPTNDTGNSNFQNTDNYYRSQKNYSNFANGNTCGGACSNRTEVVIAGANNGILHAFRTSDGEELWGYIPPPVLENFERIPSSKANSTNAIYGIDGSPSVKDIYFDDTPYDGVNNPRWRTVLISGLGAGGNAIFALDITDINNPKHLFALQNNPSNKEVYFWNSTGAKNIYSYGSSSLSNEIDYSKLGETWSTPRIIRIKNSGIDKWVAVFGGGYNSAVNPNIGSAVFVMDIENEGKLLEKIDIQDGPSNIINSIPADLSIITADGTPKANYNGAIVYATDLEGKVTKINLTDKGTLYQTTTLFEAESTSSNGRYIFTRPEVTINNDNNLWLYFGTGNTQKLQEQSNQIQNRVYGIKDENFPNFVTISNPGTIANCKTAPNCPGGSDIGWYVNLPNKQKLTAEPTIDKDRVYFPIYEPTSGTNACKTGKAILRAFDSKCGNSLLNVNLGTGVLSKVVKQGDNLYIGLAGEADKNISGFTSTDNLITGKSQAKDIGGEAQLEKWKENY
jgi:type IV pilus assembly protein PilY1